MGDQPPLFSQEHPGGEQQPNTGNGPELLDSSVQPREHVISTAITFLQNPSVKRNPLMQKQQFLRSKGLTEDEIQIACDRAGVFTGVPTTKTAAGADAAHSTFINMGISAPPGPKFGHVQLAPAKSLFQYVRDVLSSTALVAGVAYAVYLFYKNYIRPLLFGDGSGSSSSGSTSARKRRRKTPEELMEDMSRSVEKSVASINQELSRVKEELARCSRQDALQREFSGFKSDLDAIKGLLLNRKQFSSPVQPPSIPAWQIQSQQQVPKIADKPEDAGSGSGSSETEVVTKNSDSSLEMI